MYCTVQCTCTIYIIQSNIYNTYYIIYFIILHIILYIYIYIITLYCIYYTSNKVK